MKINLFKIITLLCLLSSCVRTECKDCIKLFDTTLSNNELDSIVQNLPNNNTASIPYHQFHSIYLIKSL